MEDLALRTDIPWPSPLARLSLARDEVHVWRAQLDVPESLASDLEQVLSQDELARAAKFRFPKHREEFVVAHGFLRTILGRYQRTGPSQIRLGTSRHHKPALSGATDAEPLQFSLSHSHPFALLAVTRAREIGVDVEKIRDDFDMETVAARFLSSNEISSVHNLAARDRRGAYYQYWTCKEAWLKATGHGLLLEPNQTEIAVIAGEGKWSLVVLDSIPGCAAALAVSGRGWKLRCFGFTPAAREDAAVC